MSSFWDENSDILVYSNGNIKIHRVCYGKNPCKHCLYYKGKTYMMSNKEIFLFLKEKGIESDKHFSA